MNVVRLVGDFPPLEAIHHGLGPAFYHLSKEQVKLGINVHVICKRPSHGKKFEETEGIKIYRVRKPYNFSAPYELIKLRRHIKVDLVHAHATSCPSYAIFKRYLHGKLMGKYVIHVHGTLRGVVSSYKRFMPSVFDEMKFKQRIEDLLLNMRQSLMWKSSDALIAVSGSVADELESLYGIPREKIHVVHNGVDLQIFYPQKSRDVVLKRHGLSRDSHIILYLGGFRPVKGPICVIKALSNIHEEFKRIKVLFVGNPRHPLESSFAKPILDLIKRLKLKDTVYVIKNIPYTRMPEYYSAADALVIPSIYDAFPKVTLEAMACMTPVIASAIGGLTELIHDKKTGILVKPANPDELAEAIVNVVSSDDLRMKLGLNARKLVIDRFTWSHTAKRVMSVYQKILNEH